MLDTETFKTIVKSTPLVSIDLIVWNQEGRVLLGCRKNRPAQGFWFVPGGRICKNESMDDAFKRLTHVELGLQYNRSHAPLIGVYEHMYPDSFFGNDRMGPDTHYIVLAHQVNAVDLDDSALPRLQHDTYRWWSVEQALASPLVHDNTKAYFIHSHSKIQKSC